MMQNLNLVQPSAIHVALLLTLDSSIFVVPTSVPN